MIWDCSAIWFACFIHNRVLLSIYQRRLGVWIIISSQFSSVTSDSLDQKRKVKEQRGNNSAVCTKWVSWVTHMVEALVPCDDVEEVPDLHGRPVKPGHGRRRHLLPLPVRRRQVRERRVEVPHRRWFTAKLHIIIIIALLHLHTREERTVARVHVKQRRWERK